jgi:hypothetical protein
LQRVHRADLLVLAIAITAPTARAHRLGHALAEFDTCVRCSIRPILPAAVALLLPLAPLTCAATEEPLDAAAVQSAQESPTPRADRGDARPAVPLPSRPHSRCDRVAYEL